ncbi:MAG: RNA polymerase sigma factor [Nannocystales bacterium]
MIPPQFPNDLRRVAFVGLLPLPLSFAACESPASDSGRETDAAGHDFVWSAVRRFGVPESLLQDALQDTFIVAYRRRGSFARGPTRPWLYGIARGVASNYRRTARTVARKREVLVDTGAPVSAYSDETQVSLRALDVFVASLSSEDRELFVLSETEGLTAPELSSALKVNARTVYRRLDRLRDRFAEQGDRRTFVFPFSAARLRGEVGEAGARVAVVHARLARTRFGPSQARRCRRPRRCGLRWVDHRPRRGSEGGSGRVGLEGVAARQGSLGRRLGLAHVSSSALRSAASAMAGRARSLDDVRVPTLFHLIACGGTQGGSELFVSILVRESLGLCVDS